MADEATKIGDPVHIIGFSGVVLSHELLNKSAALEASVTAGSISGLKQDTIGQDVIQTDASAAPGNSGGPAIGGNGAVVGVLTFVSLSPSGGSIVQGFNFLIPAKDLMKFLQGTEVAKPGESRFNPVWAAGLRDLSNDRFRSPAAKFGEANNLLPGLTDVKRALAEAEFKVKNPPPRPFPWAWATLGLALVSGGGYGAIWYRRWQRNRFRTKAGEVVKLLEEGVNPLLLDVRKASAAKTSPLKIPGATTTFRRRIWLEGRPESRWTPTGRSSPIVRELTRPRAPVWRSSFGALASRTCASSRVASGGGRTRDCRWRPALPRDQADTGPQGSHEVVVQDVYDSPDSTLKGVG